VCQLKGQSVTIGLAFLVCSMAEIAIKKDTMLSTEPMRTIAARPTRG
jgi:hypothetical protein